MSEHNKHLPKEGKESKQVVGKQLKYGSVATIMGIAVIAIAILFNLFISLADNRFRLQLDMTANRLYSLTDDTKAVLDGLEEEVKVYVLFKQGDEDLKILETIDLFKMRSKRVEILNIDPIRNPGFTTRFDTGGVTLSSGSIIVTNAAENRYRVLYASELYDTSASSTSLTLTGLKVESKLASAIAYVAGTDLPTVYFLQGHQEPSVVTDMYYLRDALQNNSYQAEVLNFNRNVPELTYLDVIVVVSPKTDLTTAEHEQMVAHLEKGGKAIFLFDVINKELPLFNDVLAAYGIQADTNLILENDEKRFKGNNAVLVPSLEVQEITSPVLTKNLTVLMPGMRSFTLSDKSAAGIVTFPLMVSSSNSYAKTDLDSSNTLQQPTDAVGPFDLGACAYKENKTDPKRSTKVVALGNATFISNVDYAQQQGNFELFMQSVYWMQDRTDAVVIRTKALTGVEMLNLTTMSQIVVIFIVIVLAIPLAILVYGGVVWLRRRHL